MHDNPIWSMNRQHSNSAANRLNLPFYLEKVILLSASLFAFYILSLVFTPLLGELSFYIGAFIYLLLLPHILRNNRHTTVLESNECLQVYADHLFVNLGGYYGSYTINNIVPGLLKISMILTGNFMGIGLSNGLCFKTVQPDMTLKIPLPLMKSELDTLKTAISQLNI